MSDNGSAQMKSAVADKYLKKEAYCPFCGLWGTIEEHIGICVYEDCAFKQPTLIEPRLDQ